MHMKSTHLAVVMKGEGSSGSRNCLTKECNTRKRKDREKCRTIFKAAEKKGFKKGKLK